MSCLDPDQDGLMLMPLGRVGYKPVVQREHVEHLGRVYHRYESNIENRLYKAMHELERLQRMRKGEDVHAPMVLDVQNENGFVSQNDQ